MQNPRDQWGARSTEVAGESGTRVPVTGEEGAPRLRRAEERSVVGFGRARTRRRQQSSGNRRVVSTSSPGRRGASRPTGG